MKKVELLEPLIHELLPNVLLSSKIEHGELTIVIDAADILSVMSMLKNHGATQFDQCVDLCGVDYSQYHEDYVGPRFAIVYHLLSVKHNFRMRIKAFAKNDDFPVVTSVTNIWSGTDWFEREAFDFFGIIFDGHPDLRRLLTDYGFIGHPFRKDFPLSGHMEMRYDEEQKRVIYQPVTIEPREITPRVIREENYSGRN